ncbi:MAG: class I SAM-dependent methyltransferase [Candidatus Paceibacterota bacterium]
MIRLTKRILFPGINLHARARYRALPTQFAPEVRRGAEVLDAGCGNGMLSYQAWTRGARVLGISIKQNEVDGCRAMFNVDRAIPEEELAFRNTNLYDLSAERQFDAIICTEVLEHIREDGEICAKFFQLLRPRGVLHITAPNAAHPYNASFPLDPEENGGHVRPGYTEESYRSLLEPRGFVVDQLSGIGGPIRQAFNCRIKTIQERFGPAAGLPLFLASMPFLWLDPQEPSVPFSLYVKARKPQRAATPSE